MELFLTLCLALVLSLLVAKLVSVATAGGRVSEVKSTDISHETVLEELHFGDRLSVRGFESQRKVKCVEGAMDKIDDLVGVSALSHDIIEVHLERKNEEETSQLPGDSEEIVSGEEFDGLVLVRKVSDSLDDLKKSDGSDLEQVKEINIFNSMIETTNNRHDEQIGVILTDDGANFSQTVEVMDIESKSKNEDNAHEFKSDGVDDDDWEGVERSEIENVFVAASKFVESRDFEDCSANLGRDFQMELYGLHKVATEGPCREPQPVPLKISARAKWNAWQRLGNICPEEAMERYISLLSDTFPGWIDSAGQSTAEPLEAETVSARASDIRTSLTQPNSSNEIKPEPTLGDKKGAHAGDSDMKNGVEG